MIRELYESLRPREERMFRWSAAAAAAALWFSIAWRDAWVLLLVPMIAGWFADEGELAAYDGLEFDVLYFLPDLRPAGGKFAATQQLIDVDNDPARTPGSSTGTTFSASASLGSWRTCAGGSPAS
jgi:hypothetical protein